MSTTEATQTPEPIVVHNRCKSCNAQIRFAKTDYGSTMVLDSQPVLVGGTYAVRDDGSCGFVPADHRAGMGSLFVPHFATCTNPDAHRKRKRGK
jgi:hypothetical protein